MRPSLDEYLMRLAEVAATRTTCVRRGVGCVLSDVRGRVLAVGYNGVASGLPHCSEASKGDFVVGRGSPSEYSLEDAVTRLHVNMPHVRPGSVCRPRLQKHAGGKTALEFDWLPNVCDGHDLPPGQDRCEAVHAEQNAVLQCADPDRVAAAYVTLSPCKACAKLLLNLSNCRRVVYLEEHAASAEAKALWLKSDGYREWVQLRR